MASQPEKMNKNVKRQGGEHKHENQGGSQKNFAYGG
jgi:hypothetical protein